MEGETSSLEAAHQLGKLCENRHLVVNLIPYNATDVKDKLRCPSPAHTQKFRDIVASYGTFCTIRRTMGADIASACGQLVQKSLEDVVPSIARNDIAVDIEDVVGGASTAGTKCFDKGATTQSISLDDCESPRPHLSWLSSISSETLDQWVYVLGVAAAVSASCFVASTVTCLTRRR